MPGNENSHPDPHIGVQVVTTSGKFPANGFDEVPIHQKVRVELDKAASALHLTNTTGWIATVSDRELNIDQSYQENALTGKATIDWGPREGGGGCE